MKIAIVADDHLLPEQRSADAFFPAYYNAYPEGEADRMYSAHRKVVHDCREVVLEHLQRNRPWNLVIHVGDTTSGWQGRGIAHPSLEPTIESSIAAYSSIGYDFACSWGDHDVGMRRQGGLTAESVRACHRISPLFWARYAGNLRIIGICSGLYEEYTGPEPDFIAQMRREQNKFLERELTSLYERRWILVTHKLDIGPIIPIIEPYMGDLHAVVCGHLHSPWAARAQRRLGSIAPFGAIAALRRRSIMCPSVAPLWWQGGGMIECDIRGSRVQMRPRHISMPRSLAREIRAMPFSSFTRSAFFVELNQMRRRIRSLTGR